MQSGDAEVEVQFETWKDSFATLPDPRVVGRTSHGLLDILFLTLCAVICGMDDWEAIEEWGQARLDWLRQFVALENGMPSHDTLARVFAALDPEEFEACFVRWMSALCPSLEGEIVAIDGKTARGSRDRQQAAIHMVSAFVCGQGLTLGQWKTDAKSNEITAVPELIEVLELKGAMVTLDAMGCQKAVAQALVDKGADYVFSLKGNQGTLHEAVKHLFDVTRWQNYAEFDDWGHVTEDAGHGRVERRRCVALACPAGKPFDLWSGMQSVAMVESTRTTAEEMTLERRYFVSSAPPDPKRLAYAIRSHWEVENRLHWCLDVTFGEDACRTRSDHAPQNMNIVRKIAMNLLRMHPLKKTLPKKRLRACMNPEFLGEILGVEH
jgi:predicted transposase YbfD/YdcC